MQESNGVSDANSSVGDQDQNSLDSVEQKVSYETYKRTLDEAKKAKSEIKTIREQLAKINEEKMIAEGRKDELLKQKEDELNEIKNQLKKNKAEAIINRVHGKIAEVASKFGAYDPSDVIKNISLSDLGLDEDGNFDTKSVESKVDEVRKQKQYLFKTSTARVVDANPSAKPQNLNGNALNTMSIKELEELYKSKAR